MREKNFRDDGDIIKGRNNIDEGEDQFGEHNLRKTFCSDGTSQFRKRN